MAITSSSSALIIGGIFEKEDRQYVLDDAHLVNVEKFDKYSCLRNLTVDLENWEGSSSDEGENENGSSSSDSESFSDSESSSDSELSSSEDLSSEDGEFYTRPDTIDPSIPQPFPDQALKDYFADNQEFWMTRAAQKIILYQPILNS